MTKRKRKIDWKRVREVLPYVLTAAVTLVLVFIGSLDKKNAATSISIEKIADNNYNISVDQMTEYYVVANLSEAMQLASATDTAANYVTMRSMYDSGITSSGKLDKPTLPTIAVTRGVLTYVVQEGESMEAIAARYGLSTDQVRWSNGLKTTDLSGGETLYLPSVPGVVYVVQGDDTLEGIVERYGSSVAEIVLLNDLEVSGISEGMRIVIRNGTPPTTERPEYVAPVTYYSYTYSGDSATRQNVSVVAYGFYDYNYPYPNPNPGVPGWCTWYAWYWRATDSRTLGELGHEGRNANTWNRDYAYRGVGREPRQGAVFQTTYGSGGYGHVGVVLAVNGDGSILVREMNYAGRYVVTEATIPAAYVGNFNYIY